MNLTKWDPSYLELKENEYLLKIKGLGLDFTLPLGFFAKLTKKNILPVAFEQWSNNEIYLFEETYRSGWKFDGCRMGKSQDWVRVVHPEGFVVEIYLSDFVSIVKNFDLKKGVIQGEFMWKENKLLSK